jgi:hypothetical protein
MLRTVEAIIAEDGTVRLVEDIKLSSARRALVTILEEVPPATQRPIGLCEGEFTVPDDFDDPLPPEVLKWFEGK